MFTRKGGWVHWRFNGLVGGSVLGVSLYRRPGVTTRGERAFVPFSGAFWIYPVIDGVLNKFNSRKKVVLKEGFHSPVEQTSVGQVVGRMIALEPSIHVDEDSG